MLEQIFQIRADEIPFHFENLNNSDQGHAIVYRTGNRGRGCPMLAYSSTIILRNYKTASLPTGHLFMGMDHKRPPPIYREEFSVRYVIIIFRPHFFLLFVRDSILLFCIFSFLLFESCAQAIQFRNIIRFFSDFRFFFPLILKPHCYSNHNYISYVTYIIICIHTIYNRFERQKPIKH